MERLGMEEDMAIESRLGQQGLENAQTKVEGHNFDIRKHVVEYDDVMNASASDLRGAQQGPPQRGPDRDGPGVPGG